MGPTITAQNLQAPPAWALMQRELFDFMAEAVRYAETCISDQIVQNEVVTLDFKAYVSRKIIAEIWATFSKNLSDNLADRVRRGAAAAARGGGWAAEGSGRGPS